MADDIPVDCADDPLLEPNKKKWLECAKGFAHSSFIMGIVTVLILSIVILGIMFASNAGFVSIAVASVFAMLFLFGVIYSYQVSDQTANRMWVKAKVDISRKTGDLEKFDKFDDANPEEQKELRKEWVKHGLEIQEDNREKAMLQAQQRMSRNSYNRRYDHRGFGNGGINLHF